MVRLLRPFSLLFPILILSAAGLGAQERSGPAVFAHYTQADGVTTSASVGLTAEVGIRGPLALTVEMGDWASRGDCPHLVPTTCGTGGWTLLAGGRIRFEDSSGRVGPFGRALLGRYEGSSGVPRGRASPALLVEAGLDVRVVGMARVRLSLIHQRAFDDDFEATLGEAIRYTGLRLGVGLESR
jgi:hypothetical protein